MGNFVSEGRLQCPDIKHVDSILEASFLKENIQVNRGLSFQLYIKIDLVYTYSDIHLEKNVFPPLC